MIVTCRTDVIYFWGRGRFFRQDRDTPPSSTLTRTEVQRCNNGSTVHGNISRKWGGGGGKRESKKVGSRESMREIIHSFALLSKKWKVTGVRGTKTGEHVSKAKGSPLPASLPVN